MDINTKQQKDLLDRVLLAMRYYPMSMEKISREIGVNAATIRRFITGNYKIGRIVTIKFEKWLKELEQSKYRREVNK